MPRRSSASEATRDREPVVATHYGRLAVLYRLVGESVSAQFKSKTSREVEFAARAFGNLADALESSLRELHLPAPADDSAS